MDELEIDIKESPDYYDIRWEYIDNLKIGKSNEEVTSELIEEYQNNIGDAIDLLIFWLSLAEVQWDYGRLIPKVRIEALKSVETIDLDKVEKSARRDILKILNKINSPQKPEKKVGKLKMYRTQLRLGDIYAYKISLPDYYRERYSEWDGKYIVFKNIGSRKSRKGGLPIEEYYDEFSVLAIYAWVGDYVPSYLEIKDLEFIKLYYEKNSPNDLISVPISEKELKSSTFVFICNEEIGDDRYIEQYPYPSSVLSEKKLSNDIIGCLNCADKYGKLIKKYKSE